MASKSITIQDRNELILCGKSNHNQNIELHWATKKEDSVVIEAIQKSENYFRLLF